MEVWMVAIHSQVMIDRSADLFFHSIVIGEWLPVTSAAMEFGEPNVRHAFYWAEFGCVVKPGTFVQIVSVVGGLCHNRKTLPNTVDVLAGSPFVKRDHFGCGF